VIAREPQAPPGPGPGIEHPALEELETQYTAYRRRQARGLVRLLPRDAIRPLYRRALEEGLGHEATSDDPLGALLLYCERLLPLPPFETWLEDMRLNANAHLQDLDDSADVPTAAAPSTVESRRFAFDGDAWVAQLRSYRDGPTWRGYIAFEDAEAHRVHRTALIFRETDPVDMRDRFLGFDDAALQAFLRSALP
jgi:hypothetical protein